MPTISFDFNLPGYTIIEELFQDPKTVVYRARSTQLAVGENASTVIIKLLSSAYPTYQE